MGEFARQVKNGTIHGPHTRKFKREDWEALARREDTDFDDKRLARAGIVFDDLLTCLRSEMRLSHLPLQPSAIMRLAVGLATWNYCRIAAQVQEKLPTPKPGETPILMQSSLEGLQISVAGQLFAPDELITGSGDELKYLLDALRSLPTNQTLRTEYDASRKDIDDISHEFNIAIMYSRAVEYWLDCVGLGYGLTHHQDGIAHVPYDPDQEIALQVSSYRRYHLWLQELGDIFNLWMYQLPDAAKRKLCEIPLVSQVYLAFDRIESIELSQNSQLSDSAMLAVADKVLLQSGYYQNLLNEPLPKLHNFTLNEMINGWRLLQSLASVVFDEMSARIFHNAQELPRFASVEELPRFAPKIASRVLCATVSKALRMEKHRAQQLVEVLVYRGTSSQEVWTQPLVSCEDDYWLAIPCIHAVHLERIVEGWMRQGGLELERRGPEFERFCREVLRSFVARSPIKEAITIVKQPVQFSPPGEQGEEIDLVIVIADTVLLVEAKCILWPADPLQFTLYRNTIEKAVKQIKRKHDAVIRYYTAFSNRLMQMGYTLPASPKIACCVLTNSAVFAGFPVEGVPIVDLPILVAFFENDYVKIEVQQQGKVVERHAIQFYKDKTEAGHVFKAYLLDPPSLRDMKQSVIPREVVLPYVEHRDFGKFIHTTFRVEVDGQKMMTRYGNTT